MPVPNLSFRSAAAVTTSPSRIVCELSPEALRDFQSIGMQMRLPRGAVLFQAGDLGGSIALLCEGQVKLQSTSREGKTSILKIASPGDVLGLGAVISGSCYGMTAEILEPATIKSIRKDEFLSFLHRHSAVNMYAARILSEEYKFAFFDAARLTAASSAAGRLSAVLLDLGRSASNGADPQRFTVALTHEELANLADTSRETVTRMLGRFRRERWIRIHGSSMTILAPGRLRELIS